LCHKSYTLLKNMISNKMQFYYNFIDGKCSESDSAPISLTLLLYKTYKRNVCGHVKVRNIVNHEYKFYIFIYLSKYVGVKKAETYN